MAPRWLCKILCIKIFILLTLFSYWSIFCEKNNNILLTFTGYASCWDKIVCYVFLKTRIKAFSSNKLENDNLSVHRSKVISPQSVHWRIENAKQYANTNEIEQILRDFANSMKDILQDERRKKNPPRHPLITPFSLIISMDFFLESTRYIWSTWIL